jgi:hypothetical protein
VITCSNCTNEATHQYRVTGQYSMPFCVRCLPGFLKAPQYRGRVVRIEKPVEVAVETPAPKKRSTKKKVEEPVVEEPIVEESVEEPTLDESTETPVEETNGAD